MAGDTYNSFYVNGNDNFFNGISQKNARFPQPAQQPALPPEQLPPVITDRSAWTPPRDYLRREAELKAVKALIIENTAIKLQISGIGGIGKTSFCCHLFGDCLKKLTAGKTPAEIRHLGWISYDGDLKTSVFRRFDGAGVFGEDAAGYWECAQMLFRRLNSSLLLFIDNADDMTEEELDFLRSCSCRVIVTAREQLGGLDDFPLPLLDDAQCVELYRHHSKDKKPEDETVIQQIVETAGHHTQTVCLLARTQRESGYSAQELLTALRENGFSLEDISVSVDSDRPEGNVEATFIEHMSKLFDIAKIHEPKQIHALKLFALLAPNQPLPRRTLNEWFGQDVLKKLIKRGWLNTDENGDVYIHPVIAETLKSKYPPDSADASRFVNQLTDVLTNSKGKGVAVQNRLLPHCVSVDKSLQGTETNDYAWFLDRIAVILRETGDYNRALSYWRRAVTVAENVNGTEHLFTAATYNNIGLVYQAMGDYDKALEYAQKDLTITEKVLGLEHPDTASTYNNIASVYDDMGDYDKALEYYKKALAVKEKVLGTEHPSTAATYDNIGIVYQDKGDYDKALEYYNKALKIYEKVHGTEHPSAAITYYNFGDLFRETGKPDDALEYAERARKIFEEKFGAEHLKTAMTYNLLARIDLAMHDAGTALPFAEQARDIYAKKGLTEHLEAAINFRTLAEIYLAKNDTGQALSFAEQALAVLEKKFGAAHPDTRKTYQVLAGIYEKTGDMKKADEYIVNANLI